jgi:hypothetical protein
MERLFRATRGRAAQQQPQQTQVDPAAIKKRAKSLCAYLVVAGQYAGPAAAIRDEGRGLLDIRTDESGVRYHMSKLDKGSILAAKKADPVAFAERLDAMRASVWAGVDLPTSKVEASGAGAAVAAPASGAGAGVAGGAAPAAAAAAAAPSSPDKTGASDPMAWTTVEGSPAKYSVSWVLIYTPAIASNLCFHRCCGTVLCVLQAAHQWASSVVARKEMTAYEAAQRRTL